MSISMLGSVLSDRASVRDRCLRSFKGPIRFWLELGSGCDVRVTVRLCLRLRFGGLILK